MLKIIFPCVKSTNQEILIMKSNLSVGKTVSDNTARNMAGNAEETKNGEAITKVGSYICNMIHTNQLI